MNNRFAIAMSALLMSSLAFASDTQPDKSEIIEKVATSLSGGFAKKFASTPVKPKVHIAEVNSTAESLDSNDISLITDKFESLIMKSAVVLEREKAAFSSKEEAFQQSGATSESIAMGTKLGATHLIFIAIKDQVSNISKEKEAVKVLSKLTVVEIASGRKIISDIYETKFVHKEIEETSFVRSTTSTTLGFISIGSLATSAAFAYYASESKQRYDKATNSDDAKTYREKTEQNKKFAYAALGTSVLSFGLKLWVDSGDKNYFSMHEYELTLIPTERGNIFAGGGWSWRF